MFTTPRPNLVESDAGFSVEVIGRSTIRYSEGGRETAVEGEMLAGPSGFAVYRTSLREWNNGSSIDVKERERIVENIRAAFRFQGFDIVVM